MAKPAVLLIEIGDDAAGEFPVELWDVGEDSTLVERATIRTADIADPNATWNAESIRSTIEQDASLQDLEEIGKHLVGLLGDVGTKWAAAHADHVNEGTPFRTILDIAPKAVRLLPWEAVMLNGTFPFRDAQDPVHRAAKGRPGRAADRDKLPIRILVIVGGEDPKTPPARKIGWEQELSALQKLFRSQPDVFDAEVLSHPSGDAIRKTYADFCPHVIHFIGHGVSTPGGSALELWSEDKRRLWTTSDIATDLRGEHRPCLAFINACRSGEAGAEANYDIGQIFIEKHGATSAITMLGDIKGAAAAEFALGVYNRLGAFESLDRAVARARNAMRDKYPSEWPLPVLHLVCDPCEVIPAAYSEKLDEGALVDIREEFSDLVKFVDRTDDRRPLSRKLVIPDQPSPGLKRLVVVRGKRGVGKTALTRWLVRHFSLRGREVRYVDLKDGQSKGYADVLRIIRRGNTDKTLSAVGPLPDAPFTKFDAALAKYEELGKGPAQVPVTDSFIDDLFAAFVQGLGELAASRPIAIIIDHLRCDAGEDEGAVVATHFENYLWKKFISLVAKGTLNNVMLVVVLSEPEPEKNPVFVSLLAVAEEWVVKEWDKSEYRRLTEEFFLEELDDAFTAKLIAAFEEKATGPWTPMVFKKIRDTIDYVKGSQ